MEMEQPTWQIIAGGIGRPKTVRFMYSVDGRPFESFHQLTWNTYTSVFEETVTQL